MTAAGLYTIIITAIALVGFGFSAWKERGK
jgi:hypothetical protein